MADKNYSKKKFFTTGQIAKICGVSIATVQKWIDAGEIDSYRLPLTASERRVPRESLLAFMKKYNVPTDEIQAKQSFRVLVIDSDTEYQKSIKKSLDGFEEKTETLIYGEGSEALLEAGAFQPNVIILDIHTPGMDGLKVVETLNKGNSWKDTKIVILSELDEHEQNSLKEMKANQVILKPIKLQKLKKELMKLSG